jgi:hypothetical protein
MKTKVSSEVCLDCGTTTPHEPVVGISCIQYKCCECGRINDWDFDLDDADYWNE